MRNFILCAGIAALSLPLTSPSFAQGKDQKGQGQKGQGGEQSKPAKGNGGDRKSDGGNIGGGQPTDRAQKGAAQSSWSSGKSDKASRDRSQFPSDNFARANRKNERDSGGADVIDIARREVERDANPRVRRFENGRYAWGETNFQGCPPGLAKKNNGCLPPGQARKLAGLNDQQIRWSRYSNWFSQNESSDWRYDQGYAYRVNSGSNVVQSVIPLLGGALFGGKAWPQGFTDYQVSPYHERFFGANADNAVRYANGALFGVDPKTQMIGSIVGLLTGDNWNIGSPAPQGYELYNVPSSYRDQYADSADSAYRYNDGYVYEVDPTTQIVRKIIELVV